MLRDYTTMCLPPHSEILSIIALQEAEAFLKRNRQICDENYRLLQAVCCETSHGHDMGYRILGKAKDQTGQHIPSYPHKLVGTVVANPHLVVRYRHDLRVGFGSSLPGVFAAHVRLVLPFGAREPGCGWTSSATC